MPAAINPSGGHLPEANERGVAIRRVDLASPADSGAAIRSPPTPPSPSVIADSAAVVAERAGGVERAERDRLRPAAAGRASRGATRLASGQNL